MRAPLLAACLLASTAAPARAAKDAVFDLDAILAPPLAARTLKSTEKGGIVTEEVRFHSHKDGKKSIDVFALFCYPKGAKKLPAFVWNQGGLAQASPHFPTLGAKRGYAALCIDFPLPGYRSTGGYPITSGLDLPADTLEAPIYHGAVALLRAVSYLRSRPEVHPDKVGMAGSSWGGFYTTLMVGLDPRLKAGSSMFGAGGLHLGNLWWDGQGWDTKRDKAFRERWRTTLDPAERLARSRTPLAWFTGTNDQFYWLPGVVQSYERAAGPKHLALLPNWDHALTPELDEQTFAWLDVHLKGAMPFLEVGPIEVKADGLTWEARWSVKGKRKVARAELALSHGAEGNWVSRCWRTFPADVRDGTCIVKLPPFVVPAHITGSVIDTDGFRSSTPTKLVRPVTPGRLVRRLLDYDGAAAWGGFEDDHVRFLRLHGLPVPKVSKDAREGKQSAALAAGKTTLPPLLFTAGEAHRLRCWLKADTPTDVTLHLDGRFDGKPAGTSKGVKVGTDWTESALEFTPPGTLTGRLTPSVTVPAGASVRLDAVTFTPVPGKR